MTEAQVTASGRLRLRRPVVDDLDVVFALHGDPRTNLHNPAGPDADRDVSAERLLGWIEHWERHGFGYWVVELVASGEVLGVSGLRHETWLDQPVLNLYYRFAADHWGRGCAGEVAAHAVRWARASCPELPVLAYTTLDNLGSQRTAEVAGLVRRRDLEHVLNGVHAVVFVSHWLEP